MRIHFHDKSPPRGPNIITFVDEDSILNFEGTQNIDHNNRENTIQHTIQKIMRIPVKNENVLYCCIGLQKHISSN